MWQFQGPVIGALRSETKHVGPDFTATGIVALGQRLGGTGFGLNYFQAVSQYLSLGGAFSPCSAVCLSAQSLFDK
jgi:hypothetical protein